VVCRQAASFEDEALPEGELTKGKKNTQLREEEEGKPKWMGALEREKSVPQ
jgi:hypothetical protein